MSVSHYTDAVTATETRDILDSFIAIGEILRLRFKHIKSYSVGIIVEYDVCLYAVLVHELPESGKLRIR